MPKTKAARVTARNRTIVEQLPATVATHAPADDRVRRKQQMWHRLSHKIQAQIVVSDPQTIALFDGGEQYGLVSGLQTHADSEPVRELLRTLASNQVQGIAEPAVEVAKAILDTAARTPAAKAKAAGKAKIAVDEKLDWFTGVVNRITKQAAFVELIDEGSRAYVARLKPKLVADAGLEPGDEFFCVLSDNPDGRVQTQLRKWDQPPLTPEEKVDIERLVGEVVDLLAAPEADHAEKVDPPGGRPVRPRKVRKKAGRTPRPGGGG